MAASSFGNFSSWYRSRTVINYSLSQNSESLKSATEPPENPARAEKRGANLPKPLHEGLIGKGSPAGTDREVRVGVGVGVGWGGKQWGLPKGNVGKGARPRDKSGPHRCSSGASAVPGASRPPENSDPRRDRRHPRGPTTQCRASEVRPGLRPALSWTPPQTQREEGHSSCRSFLPAAAAPWPESGATLDAASTSSPRGLLTAQTPHLRLRRPFGPGIKEPAST